MLDESRFSFLPRKPSTLTAAPSDVATRMTARPLAMRSQAQSTVVVPGGRQVADTQKMAQSVAVVDDHDHDHDHSSSERHRKLEAARRRLQQFKEERHAGAVVVVDDLNAAGQMASSSPLDGGTLGELVARCRQYESHIHALQETIAQLRQVTTATSDDRAKLEALQAQNLVILRNSSQIEEVNKQLNRRNLELIDQLAVASARLSALESGATVEVEQANATAQETMSMLATLQTQQLEATQLIRQLQLDVELRDKRIAALDHDVSAAQQFRDDRERQVEMLTADRATLAKDLHRANEDLVNLRRQLSRSENAATEHATSDRNAVAKAVEQVEQHLAAREHAWSEERDTFQRQLDEARANIQQQVDANMAQHQQATVDLRAELETARADLAAASDTATYHAHLKQENTALFQQINDLRAQFSATVEEKTKAVEQVERLQAINKRIIGELRAFEGYRGEVEQLKEIIRQQTPIVSPTSVSTGTDARGDADDDEEVTGEAERRLLHEHDARHVQQPTIDTDALLETLEEERNRSLKLEEELAALKRELAERVNTTAITDNAENNTATSAETVESEPSSPTIKDYITLEQHLDLVMADRDSFGTRLEEAAAANRALKQRLARAEHLSAQLQMESETVPLYIARYHDERRLLRKKSEEKDRLITEMVAHHRAMTDRLHYLTAAVDQLRVERRLFRDDTNGELESTESGAPQSETVDDRANDFAHADALAARSKALSRAAAEVIDDDDVDVYYPRSPVERGNHVKDELDSRFITYPPCPDCNDAEPIDV